MLITTATTIFALVSTYVTLRSRRAGTAQLIEPRASLPVIGIQIICGDCSGDEERPRKTYMDRFGNCAQCGGSSHMLASNRAAYAHSFFGWPRRTKRSEV